MMASFFQKIQDAVDKLNKVDVGAQLSKLKDIKIEDLRNISFSDLRGNIDPMTLSVVESVVFFGAGLYIFTFPEWRAWASILKPSAV